MEIKTGWCYIIELKKVLKVVVTTIIKIDEYGTTFVIVIRPYGKDICKGRSYWVKLKDITDTKSEAIEKLNTKVAFCLAKKIFEEKEE